MTQRGMLALYKGQVHDQGAHARKAERAAKMWEAIGMTSSAD